MKLEPQIVLSASRRTDIPAFYMPWFMAQIRKGSFEVVTPYNQRISVVPATSDEVHTIVFWSKNFGPFIDQNCGGQLLDQGYNLFFNFTINSIDAILEPNVPPLSERLEQLKYLSDHFGARSISWRFDPICYYQTGQGDVHHNLHDLDTIGDAAGAAGIERCITSFMDHYAKVRRRLALRRGMEFIDPPPADKGNTLVEMENRLSRHNIQLSICCEKEVLATLAPGASVTTSSCIPNDLLMELYGGKISLRKDAGQRIKAGCGCKVSVDIGSYREQPCYHNCLFCYANPASGIGLK